MSPITEALARVRARREAVDEEQTAYDRFERCVRNTRPTPADSPTRLADGGTVTMTSSAPRDATAPVRERFAETVASHVRASEDEPLSETLRTELGADVGAALTTESPGQFTPPLRDAVLAVCTQRQAQLRAMERALETEAESLQSAEETVESITVSLAAVDGTPALQLGFDALAVRHETLETHAEDCEAVLATRQRVLQGTTSHDGTAGLRHHSLVTSLYDGLPTVYPVLSSVIRLYALCRDAQRTVRDHLTRRV